jgi:hypothetical protein
MAGVRDYSDAEIDLVRKSFGGRYALRDRCYSEMALQMGLRVSEMLNLTVGQVFRYGKVVEEISIDRKFLKGGKAGKASGRILPVFSPTKLYILAWLQCMASMLKVKDPKDIDPTTPLFMFRVRDKDGSRRAISREQALRIIKGIAGENELPGAGGVCGASAAGDQRPLDTPADPGATGGLGVESVPRDALYDLSECRGHGAARDLAGAGLGDARLGLHDGLPWQLEAVRDH